MKRLFQILAMVTFISSLQGCSDSNDTEINQFKELELKFSGNINALRPASRVNANGFEVNDNIGFYISKDQTLKQNGNILDNEKFVNAGDVLVAPKNKEVYWHSSDARYSVWAYYPYIENINNYKEINLLMAADQTDEATYFDNDFLVVNKRDMAPQEAPVELTFDHAMSKIAIKLIAGDNITEEELQNATKSLRIENVIIDGTINLENSTCTTGSTVATITPYNEDGLNYAAIVFPQQDCKASIKMEIDGYTYAYNTSIWFQQGRQHTFEFTVDKWVPLQMRLSALKISNWRHGVTKSSKLTCVVPLKDPKFKEYLLSQAIEIRHERYGKVWYEYVSYDTDGDGEFNVEEVQDFTHIDVTGLGISDLSGIECFTNLEELYCANNQLSTLNLANNTKLISLECNNNQLTFLNISNSTDLQNLDCSYNQITTLDISNNIKLKNLYCNENQLSSLELSNNSSLRRCNCSCNRLTTLDVSNNKFLYVLSCYGNPLATIYMAARQSIGNLSKPEETEIVRK